MNKLNSLTVDQLAGYFSDFHKDVHGFRPRGIGSPADWESREWLCTQIDLIHSYMDTRKQTFEGREELRVQGWVIEESDPELAQYAKWLADERSREYAEWSAEMDAEYYGAMKAADL